MIKILFNKKMAALGIGLTAITLTSGNIFAATTLSTPYINNNRDVSTLETQESLNKKAFDAIPMKEKSNKMLKFLKDFNENYDKTKNENCNKSSNKSSNKTEKNKQNS